VSERRLPPVTELGMTSLALIVIGGIYLSAHLPRHVPLAPAIALLAASSTILGVNLILLGRVKGFAWGRFALVFKWSLVAYGITAGMILYAFIHDHVHGSALLVLALSLVVYAVQVPVLIAFTVARFAEPAAPADAAVT
jgi:hypothetical protein